METRQTNSVKVVLVNHLPKTQALPNILPKNVQTVSKMENKVPVKEGQKTNKKQAQRPKEAFQKTTSEKQAKPSKKAPQKLTKKIIKKSPTQVSHQQKQVKKERKPTEPTLDEMIQAYQQNRQATPHKANHPAKAIAIMPTKKTMVVPIVTPRNKDVEQAYKKRLRTLISQKKSYPLRARRAQKEGIINISFIIYSDGKIKNIHLESRSVHKILNQAAIKTIKRISGRLPFPTTIKRKQWRFSLPIIYRLR